MYVYYIYALSPWKIFEGTGSPELELGIIVSCYEYWNLNLSPLQTPLFLTNEPSLLPEFISLTGVIPTDTMGSYFNLELHFISGSNIFSLECSLTALHPHWI